MAFVRATNSPALGEDMACRQDRRFRNSSRALEAGDLALSTSGLKPRGRRAGNAVNTIHCTGLIGAALTRLPLAGTNGGTGLGEGNNRAVHVSARATLTAFDITELEPRRPRRHRPPYCSERAVLQRSGQTWLA